MSRDLAQYTEELVFRIHNLNELAKVLCSFDEEPLTRKEKLIERKNEEFARTTLTQYEEKILEELSQINTVHLLNIAKIVENNQNSFELLYAMNALQVEDLRRVMNIPQNVKSVRESFVMSARMAYERTLNIIANELFGRIIKSEIRVRRESPSLAERYIYKINRILDGGSTKMQHFCKFHPIQHSMKAFYRP